VRYIACIVPPIPPKLNLSTYYADDSEAILERKEGMQIFLDYIIKHKVMCGSEDLSSFLTGQDHEFENRKAQSSVYISSDPLNTALSQVLTDGYHAFEPITSNNTYLGQTMKLAKKAT